MDATALLELDALKAEYTVAYRQADAEYDAAWEVWYEGDLLDEVDTESEAWAYVMDALDEETDRLQDETRERSEEAYSEACEEQRDTLTELLDSTGDLDLETLKALVKAVKRTLAKAGA